jgi:hypothetical protein
MGIIINIVFVNVLIRLPIFKMLNDLLIGKPKFYSRLVDSNESSFDNDENEEVGNIAANSFIQNINNINNSSQDESMECKINLFNSNNKNYKTKIV